MPRTKHTTLALLDATLPLAVSEGWTLQEIADACHCGAEAASVALAAYREKMEALRSAQTGELLARLQKEAAQERPAVIRRLREAGAVADDLLSKARELIEALNVGEPAAIEGGEVETVARGRAGPAIEQRLAALASTVKAAASASRDCWLAFKDAAGLEFAEDLARVQAKAAALTARPVGSVLVPNVVVEIDVESER